jgi:Uma2 family endonuclease
MLAGRKPVTVAEFETFLTHPENQSRLFELVQGAIVEKMPTQRHGILVLNLGSALRAFVKTHGLGRVGVEVRHRAPDDPLNDRMPDISFVSGLDKPIVDEGAVLAMPDLAVEVKSPTDRFRDMRAKARFYITNGTQLVWLIFPEQRVVEVYAPDDEVVLGEGELLTGGALLPGFEMPVEAIFEVE